MKKILEKNVHLFLSLVIIIGMFGIFSLYYGPESAVRQGVAAVTHERRTDVGGEFSLINQEGVPFTDKNLLGKYALVFFGFTNCPDICPPTLMLLSSVYDQLSKEQQEMLNVVMITVDPETDSPEKLAAYLPNFHEEFIGLTGSREEINATAKKYLVYHAKMSLPKDGVPAPKSPAAHAGHGAGDHSGHMNHGGAHAMHKPASLEQAYEISHSGYIYLMAPDGSFIRHFSHKTEEAQLLEQLKKLLFF